jgi:hypothetical protein
LLTKSSCILAGFLNNSPDVFGAGLAVFALTLLVIIIDLDRLNFWTYEAVK